jgi:DNA-binding transcriptional regulator YbjK
VPPSNQQRRDSITSAAIEIVASEGLHGLSHRAVDEAAGVPRGTTSNYFRSRDALLEGTVRRVVDLHFAMMKDRRSRYPGRPQGHDLIEFLSGVVETAVTEFRERYIAMFELALESTRRPAFKRAFLDVTEEAMKLVFEMHRGEDDTPSQEEIALLNVFYNGALFTSLVMPQSLGGRTPAEITRAMLKRLLESGN